MACAGSSKQLDSLFEHICSTSKLSLDLPPPSARFAHFAARGGSALDSDWAVFASPRPRSQIQALPPLAHWDSDFGADHDVECDAATWAEQYGQRYAEWSGASTLSGLVAPRQASEFHMTGEHYDSIPDTSARWSPEVETAIEASRRSTASPALSASSYASTVPTPEEAARVCCERGRSLLADCCRRSKGRLFEDDDDEGSPHPLTFHASCESDWDFDRLFSRRKWWSDGRRRKVDVDEPPDTGLSSRAHEGLRVTALSRLSVIVGHLGAAW